jgi:O-6-methylguanine DNA methyltransferase
VPAGKVTTYAAIARFLKNPRAVRAVGQALNRNPQLIKIPCHRVVCSDGRVGGYFSGSAKKRRLLADEGVRIKNGRIELKRFGIINF